MTHPDPSQLPPGISPRMYKGQHVHHSSEPVYRVRVWDSVHRSRVEETVVGYIAALARLAELKQAFADGKQVRAKRPRVKVATAFRDYLVDFSVLPNGNPRPLISVAGEQDMYAYYFGAALEDFYLDEIRLVDLNHLVKGLTLNSGQRASAGTKSKVAGTLKRFFRWCAEEDLMETNPALNLRSGWGGTLRRKLLIPSLPMVEQQAQWFEGARAGSGDIVRVLAYTGMRWSEAVAVHLDDVDLDAQTIRIWRTAPESALGRDIRDDDGKSAAAERTIVIPDEAIMPMRRLMKRAREQHLRRPYHPMLLITAVRPTKNSAYYSKGTWNKIVAQVRKAHPDVKIYSAHELRHVCASILIAAMSGGMVTDVMVSRQMGHSRVEITKNIYAHLFALAYHDLLAAMNDTVARLWVNERPTGTAPPTGTHG